MSSSKRWLITGISSGIGAALAEAVLKRGDLVIGTARGAEDVARFTASVPGRSIGVQLDVTNPQEVEQTVARILSDGPLDVVVNNAGQSIYGAFEETSVAEAKALFDVNVFGPWALAQAVLPHFREKRAGQLVHMSSGCGLNGMGGLSAYCASKFALEGFTESLAQEAAQFGIKVLLVEPGAVATKFISHGTRETVQRIADYGFISGAGKAGLEGYYEACAASPASVAEAVLAAVGNPDAPLRLILGDDVREPIRAKAAQMLELVAS